MPSRTWRRKAQLEAHRDQGSTNLKYPFLHRRFLLQLSPRSLPMSCRSLRYHYYQCRRTPKARVSIRDRLPSPRSQNVKWHHKHPEALTLNINQMRNHAPPTSSLQPGAVEPSEQRFSNRLRAAMESAYRNDILDDALPRRRARVQQEGQSGPVREKEDQKINPYLAQNAFFEEDNLDEFVAEFKRTPPQHVNRDHWAGLLPRPGILRRHHVKWRTHAFSPWEKDIGSSRRVVGCYKGGDQDSEEDDWSMQPSKKAAGKWKGHTDFFLTKQAAKDLLERHQEPYTAEILTAQIYKMANDEVGESSIQPDDWEGWKNTDAEEWAKIQASGTVRVLSTEESNKVSAQLQKEGKEDRILNSRLVRRNKPSEQPGEPAQKKSRLVIRGFEDPDACSLDRYSNLNVILQMAATLKFWGSCGDLKQAFMQSGRLKREAGKIYMWQPSCGLPGLEEGQIIEILHGVYGLIDAPLHWRRTLKAFLTEELQYRQCRLDPCVLVLHVEGAINGVIVVEVDDLLCFGLKEHELRLQKLRERFAFGKFLWLQDLPQGTSFNGRRIRQEKDYSLKVDVCKFVTERMSEVRLERGRRSQPAAIGSLAWAAIGRAGPMPLQGPASWPRRWQS